MNFLTTEIDYELLEKLKSALNTTPIMALLLLNRGLKNIEEAKLFLEPDLSALFDPFLLKDMPVAAERVHQAILNGEKILVYGDEDVDGISSTVILMQTLKNLGADVHYIIPSKANDGIGLRQHFIEQANQNGVSLIITVDCGTTNFTQVQHASELGIDIIISDHHEVLSEIPKALAVINPKQIDCPYPFKKLSGAGIAYKLSQAIAMRTMGISAHQWYSVQEQLLCYVLLGTIGDRVPLIGENRIFVKFGFEVLQKVASPWIKAILENYHPVSKPVNMGTVLSLFIPLLSAGESVEGRNVSCELLLTDDIVKAHHWVTQLYNASQDWLTRARAALDKIKSNLNYAPGSELLFVDERETEVDVLSYCASKLKDLLKRPVIMLGYKDDHIVGEARAPRGFDLMECFRACEEFFIDYGGHKCAAGFSLDPKNLEHVIARLSQIANKTPQNIEFPRASKAEIEFALDEINDDLFKLISKMAPFGEGNSTPTFLLKNVEIRKFHDGYRINTCHAVFWGTRRIRNQLNFSNDVVVKGNVEFFVDEIGRGYISRVHYNSLPIPSDNNENLM